MSQTEKQHEATKQEARKSQASVVQVTQFQLVSKI